MRIQIKRRKIIALKIMYRARPSNILNDKTSAKCIISAGSIFHKKSAVIIYAIRYSLDNSFAECLAYVSTRNGIFLNGQHFTINVYELSEEVRLAQVFPPELCRQAKTWVYCH